MVKTKLIQSWKALLTTSGGKLNPGKCDVYMIQLKFQEDETPTLNNTSHYKISIISSIDGTIVKYIYPYELIIYLGYTSQLDGNQHASFNILIKNTKTFARRVIYSSMSRQQAIMAINIIINLITKDSLSTTILNDKLIEKLHKNIHPTIISGIGYSSR